MELIIKALSTAIDLIPRITLLASEVAPFIVDMKRAYEHLGTLVAPDDAALIEFKQKLDDLEASFKDAVAERLKMDEGEGGAAT